MNDERNDWLDLCRACAITMVVLSHGAYFLWPIVDQAKKLDILGILGVELFFVLSGFLVGRIMIEQFIRSETKFGWVHTFWLRRWLRTVPSYLLFFGLNYLLLQTAVRPAEPSFLPPYLLFLQNLAWPHPSFFAEAWSLSVEEVFYFITPLLLMAANAAGIPRAKGSLLVPVLVLVASFAARVGAVVSTDPTWSEGVRKIVAFRLDSIMFGVLLAMAYGNAPVWMRLKRFSPALVALLLPCVAMAYQGYDYLDHSVLARTTMFPMISLGFAGVIILGLDVRLKGRVRTTCNRVARWSYAGYLVNLPVFNWINYMVGPSPTMTGWALRWFVFMALTTAVSALVFRLFESRVLAFRDRRFASRSAALPRDTPQPTHP